jgi:photosystem II stability/assembly factor-like uncharacterized protein
MCTAVVTAAHPANAGIDVWTSSGLAGIYVRSLAFDASALYAGTGRWFGDGTAIGEVYKSTDGGISWISANMGSRDPVTALAIDPSLPDTLYAGIYHSVGSAGGILKSTDGGATWSAVNTGLPTVDIAVVALAIDPTSSGTVYAGTFSYGVYKSTDGGSTWAAANTGLPGTDIGVAALAIDPTTPDTLYAGVAYGSSPGVYKTTDGGNTWNALDTGSSPIFALAIDPSVPGTIYAGTAYFGVLKSTDGGGTWGGANYGQFMDTVLFALAVDPNTPGTLFAAGDGVFKSGDGGSSWEPFDAGLPSNRVEALAIAPASPSTLYAGTLGTFSIEIACADDGNPCTNDVYDDTGTCQHPSVPESHPCPDDGNACTDDVCDGAGSCTHPHNTTPCEDGDACTANDACSGGTCVPGGPPTACATAFGAKVRLEIKTDADSARLRQKLKWTWMSAAPFDVAALGNPTTDDDLVVCIRDATGVRFQATAPAGGSCGTRPCWSRTDRRVQYKDPQATPDGLTKLVGRTGVAGRGKLQAFGKGPNLALPSLPLALPVTVHLVRKDSSACWQATYSTSIENDATRFRARGQ